MTLFQQYESDFLRLKYILIQFTQTQDSTAERKMIEHLKAAEEAVRHANGPSYRSIFI